MSTTAFRPSVALAIFSALLFTSAACRRRTAPPPQPPQRTVKAVASGVVYRYFPQGDALSPPSPVHVLDIDLRTPGIQLRIAARNTELYRGAVYGDALTIPDWLMREGALAGVNGGFFGETSGTRKQVVGLLARNGRVESSGSLYRSPLSPDRKFVRSVLALDTSGLPHIGWMTGQRGRSAVLKSHDQPLNPGTSKPFTAVAAVACGPRLIADGQVQISDLDEKLGNPEPLPRTFAAFDADSRGPRRLLLCISPAMTYSDAASFAQAYFRELCQSKCWDAMCLDGGSSSQMAYRTGDTTETPYYSPVTVPTALIVLNK